MGRLILIGFMTLLFFSFSNTIAKDHDEAYELLRSGEILSLQEILEINSKQITGRILEVELEHEGGQMIYEIEVLDNNGIVWEIKLDARSGKIIKQEQD
jgi:uncharacterized membrane protein YkoI